MVVERGVRDNRRHAERGAALLLAMIIVVLVAAVTAGMVWQQSRAVQIEAAERARAQSAWILSGALDWARLILREDLRDNQRSQSPHDGLDEPWATPLAEARLSTFLAADKNNNSDAGVEAFLSGAIADAQARFNLRGLIDDGGKPVQVQVAALARLCALAGLPMDTAARIGEGLVSAWSLTGLDGEGRPLDRDAQPLRPARFADLSWLGLDADALSALQPWVDLLPTRTPVNLNTAPREVMVAAIDGIDVGSAERLVQARQREPFSKLDDVKALLGPNIELDPNRVSVLSNYFVVSGRLRLDERVLEEQSLLVRRDSRVDVLRRERRSFTAVIP